MTSGTKAARHTKAYKILEQVSYVTWGTFGIAAIVAMCVTLANSGEVFNLSSTERNDWVTIQVEEQAEEQGAQVFWNTVHSHRDRLPDGFGVHVLTSDGVMREGKVFKQPKTATLVVQTGSEEDSWIKISELKRADR